MVDECKSLFSILFYGIGVIIRSNLPALADDHSSLLCFSISGVPSEAFKIAPVGMNAEASGNKQPVFIRTA